MNKLQEGSVDVDEFFQTLKDELDTRASGLPLPPHSTHHPLVRPPPAARWLSSPAASLHRHRAPPACLKTRAAGKRPEQQLRVGASFIAPLPIGTEHGLHLKSMESRSKSEDSFHLFRLAALEHDLHGKLIASVYHSVDCGCEQFCYPSVTAARESSSRNAILEVAMEDLVRF